MNFLTMYRIYSKPTMQSSYLNSHVLMGEKREKGCLATQNYIAWEEHITGVIMVLPPQMNYNMGKSPPIGNSFF